MTPRKGMRVEVYWEGRPHKGVITGWQYQDWADDAVLLVTTDTGRALRVEQERVVTWCACEACTNGLAEGHVGV